MFNDFTFCGLLEDWASSFYRIRPPAIKYLDSQGEVETTSWHYSRPVCLKRTHSFPPLYYSLWQVEAARSTRADRISDSTRFEKLARLLTPKRLSWVAKIDHPERTSFSIQPAGEKHTSKKFRELEASLILPVIRTTLNMITGVCRLGWFSRIIYEATINTASWRFITSGIWETSAFFFSPDVKTFNKRNDREGKVASHFIYGVRSPAKETCFESFQNNSTLSRTWRQCWKSIQDYYFDT